MEKLKNAIQVVNVSDVSCKLGELLERYYETQVTGDNCYFEFYPNSLQYGESEGFTKEVNKLLLEDGFSLPSDEYGYLLIYLSY